MQRWVGPGEVPGPASGTWGLQALPRGSPRSECLRLVAQGAASASTTFATASRPTSASAAPGARPTRRRRRCRRRRSSRSTCECVCGPPSKWAAAPRRAGMRPRRHRPRAHARRGSPAALSGPAAPAQVRAAHPGRSRAGDLRGVGGPQRNLHRLQPREPRCALRCAAPGSGSFAARGRAASQAGGCLGSLSLSSLLSSPPLPHPRPPPSLQFLAQFLNSAARTEDPYEANLFFIPAYTYGYSGNTNEGAQDEHLWHVTNHVKAHWPFWNRTQGRDHIVVRGPGNAAGTGP